MRISDWSSDVCSSDLGPFYAVKIHPGDGSTTVGLRIDPQCRVTDANGDPFEGLYAAGLDANSIWRGKSPAHGCNVGPAVVLGYIAGKSQIGTASFRERVGQDVWMPVVAVSLKKKII